MAKEEKKAIGKKIFNLDEFKAGRKLDDGVKDKPLEFIQISPAFQKTLGVSIPTGTVTILRGYSNTGKSTALISAAIGCQRQGILPIIIDTENGFKFEHAREMGFEYREDIDEETGEVGQPKGQFIYIDNDKLIRDYSKKKYGKDRDVAVIEDVADCVNDYLALQTNGELPMPLCFLWDSVGTLDCNKSIESKSSNNQWNAGSIEQCFKSILNYRIPASRKEGKPYTNTFVVVNKIWLDAMQGAGVVKNKGGEAIYYAARLIVHFGGIQSHATKKLVAKANGKDYIYGTQTKVSIDKNHVTGTSYKGELVSTAHGFIMPDDIELYKKENKAFILSKLGLSDMNTDISYIEEIGFDSE